MLSTVLYPSLYLPLVPCAPVLSFRGIAYPAPPQMLSVDLSKNIYHLPWLNTHVVASNQRVLFRPWQRVIPSFLRFSKVPKFRVKLCLLHVVLNHNPFVRSKRVTRKYSTGRAHLQINSKEALRRSGRAQGKSGEWSALAKVEQWPSILELRDRVRRVVLLYYFHVFGRHWHNPR